MGQSRIEKILEAIVNGDDVSTLDPPQSRNEYLLQQVLEKINDISIDPEQIATAVDEWLEAHPEATTTVQDGSISRAKLDSDLKEKTDAISGKVAIQQGSENAGKALIVGDNGSVMLDEAGVPDAVKTALLNLVQHVAYIDDQGQAYYDALYAALYGGSGGYPRLEAVYAPGSHVVYTDDALDTLRPYLTVKRRESEQDGGTVVTDYTLSGTLVDGMSTVLVRKDALVTAVQVEAVDYYNQPRWSLSDGTLAIFAGGADKRVIDSETYPVITQGPNQSLIRKAIVAKRGTIEYKIVNGDNPVVDSGVFVVPVPDNANKLKISIEPATQGMNYHIYDSTEGQYILDSGWVQGLSEAAFNANANLWLIIAIRRDSSNTAYDADSLPTDVIIEYEEV